MSELKELLWTPATIVGIVLGIIGGIATNYFQRSIDKILGKWSDARKSRYETLDAEYRSLLEKLVRNPALVLLYVAEENRLRWKALGRFGTGLMFSALTFFFLLRYSAHSNSPLFIIQTAIFAGSAVLTLAAGLVHLRAANYHSSVLESIYRVEATIAEKTQTPWAQVKD